MLCSRNWKGCVVLLLRFGAVDGQGVGSVRVISRMTMVFAVIVVLLAFVLALLHFAGGAPCGTGRQQMPGIEDQQTSVAVEPCRPTMAERELQAAEIGFWGCLVGLVISGSVDLVRRERA